MLVWLRVKEGRRWTSARSFAGASMVMICETNSSIDNNNNNNSSIDKNNSSIDKNNSSIDKNNGGNSITIIWGLNPGFSESADPAKRFSGPPRFWGTKDHALIRSKT